MIIIKISDGLGNQLFQYAYALYLRKKGEKVCIDASDINNLRENTVWTRVCGQRAYQLEQFNITIGETSKVNRFFRWEEQYRRNSFFRYMDVLQLSPYQILNERHIRHPKFKYRFCQNYYVKGYFFEKRYYEEVLSELRNEISLKKPYFLSGEIQRIFRDYDTVSIHFRRGDLLGLGRDMSGSDYYKNAVAYIKRNSVNPYFIVFSDDTEWVKNKVDLGDQVLFASDLGLTDCEEVILMSQCKNHIIANSTYSFWGALLNQNDDKIVIAPKNWRDRMKPKEWVNL